MPKTIFLLTVSLCATNIWAEEPIQVYKCGNEYTNNLTEVQAKNCKLLTAKPLSKAEKERLQKCQLEATKAPTEMGVRVALAICKDKAEK